ncbi:MAG: DUF748 domain-containing protein [Candidatus Omnitrophica bacterium]|nr:DUF748 domain-containing protein [Candidatus Omnitrophota bacterium]
MKHWIRILFIIILVLALLYSGLYIFMAVKGKALIIKGIEDFTHKKVSIAFFDFSPPFNLQMRDLNIEGLAKVESVSVSPSIPYLLTGNIALNNVTLVRPRVTYQRDPALVTESAATTPAPATTIPGVTANAVAATVRPAKKQPLRLIFKRFNIKGGRIGFIDRTVGSEGIKLAVKDINLNLTNLYLFPFSAITNFDLQGKIPWQEGQEEGKVTIEGWINLHKKDIQATLKIEGIDGIYLYPYYSQWVDLGKARIERANLNFTSNIQGLNNNVTAECHLELTDIVRKQRAPDEPQEKAEKIADAVLDIFRALNQGKIVLDFTMRTKMDRPEFGFGNIKMAVENKLAEAARSNEFKAEDVLALPGKFLEGLVKGAADLSKAVVVGTFAVGKEIKRSVDDAFRKEK